MNFYMLNLEVSVYFWIMLVTLRQNFLVKPTPVGPTVSSVSDSDPPTFYYVNMKSSIQAAFEAVRLYGV